MITIGLMTIVKNGKNYSRALNSQKTLKKSNFLSLINKFIEEHELSNNLKLLNEVFFCIMLIKIAGSFL